MSKQSSQNSAAAGLDQHLSIAAVADALKLSHWTVRNYIYLGLLPAFKVGPGIKAPIRIRAADVDKLLVPITPGELVGQFPRGP